MNPVFAILLAVAGLFTLAVELYGVHRDGKGDTYSEGVWWLRDRLPKPVWFGLLAGLAAFFGWVIYHFGWQG